MRKFSLITALAILCLATVYFGWAYHRTTDQFFWDTMENNCEYPRIFPYPDAYLIAMNEWFESRYPAPPGVLKLHSEWARVRQAMFRCTLFSGASLAAVVVTIAVRRSRRGTPTGTSDSPHSA